MNDSRVVSYILEQTKNGIPKEAIINNLKSAGWSEEIIKDSFIFIEVPRPEVAPIVSSENKEIKVKAIPKENDLNSPYSMFLGIVLFVSLYILMNGVFSDIREYAKNINSALMFQGLFIIPFLLVAFLIHNSLKEQNERFKILSLPYFAISAWILLRLLWKVAQYLLSADTAIGIYVVLGMVIAVLTGIIIFVQKYIKN